MQYKISQCQMIRRLWKQSPSLQLSGN